jgi:hypothetical protein
MDQAVMVFAGTAARSSAIGTASEGMVSYLSDSNALQFYDGADWQPVDSGSSSGNAIINGAFEVNQRNFTTTSGNSIYGFDRWRSVFSGGTYTYSAQAFTPGAAPVAGYEAANFARITTSGQSAGSDYGSFAQSIEDVRSFAGQTVTLSFWAKASIGTPGVAAAFEQRFGSGGSPSSNVVTHISKTAITSSWARYIMTVAVPALTGKTIGTNANTSDITLYMFTSGGSSLNPYVNGLGVQNVTIDFWGVQVESGSTATPFRRNANSIQGELAACQRYYFRSNAFVPYGHLGFFGTAKTDSTTVMVGALRPPVTMRTQPTSIDFASMAWARDWGGSATSISAATLITSNEGSQPNVAFIEMTTTGISVGNVYQILGNNSAAAFIGVSAEL